jgi:hypothetical protein
MEKDNEEVYRNFVARFRRDVPKEEEEEQAGKIVRIPRPGYRNEDARHLSDLVIQGKRGIKYYPSLTTRQGGEKYITDRKLDRKKWKVEEGDLDNDPNTPDNVVIWNDDKPKFIDGYTLAPRRPDFLYRTPKYSEQFVGYKQLEPAQRKIKTSQLKRYLTTHVTQESQGSEDVNAYIDRDDKNRHEKMIHKMYLEDTHMNDIPRTEVNRLAFEKKYAGLTKLPSAMLRDVIADKLKVVEQRIKHRFGDRTKKLNNKVADKLNLIRIIYDTIVEEFKERNNIHDELDKQGRVKKKVNPTQVHFLTMVNDEQEADYYNLYWDSLLKDYPKKKIDPVQPAPPQ